MAGKNYADLIVWQKAMDFVEAVYRATSAFPKEEIYRLTSQMRRAAVSIPSNIAEGQGRKSPREFHRFLSVAHGSVREIETQVLIAERLPYLDSATKSQLMERAAEIGRLLNGLMNSLSRTQ
jgi:four helix bundle protein